MCCKSLQVSKGLGIGEERRACSRHPIVQSDFNVTCMYGCSCLLGFQGESNDTGSYRGGEGSPWLGPAAALLWTRGHLWREPDFINFFNIHPLLTCYCTEPSDCRGIFIKSFRQTIQTTYKNEVRGFCMNMITILDSGIKFVTV